MIDARRFPHLAKAMARIGQDGYGMCIHRAAGLVLDLPGATLMFGTIRAADKDEQKRNSSASDEPFIHAWAEYKGGVLAPTLIEQIGGLHPMDRESYYHVNGVKDVKPLTRPQLLRISREIGLSAHLLKGKPTKGNVSVGASLLNAAGVKWKDSPKGGLIPA